MIAMMIVASPALVSATMAMASRMPGIAIIPSISRISTASRLRNQPANRPRGRPIRIDPIVTPAPTASETRAP